MALKRLIDVSMGVIAPLSEQLTKPLPNAMVLVNLKELSGGAYKLLPEGDSDKNFPDKNQLFSGFLSIGYFRYTLGCLCTR